MSKCYKYKFSVIIPIYNVDKYLEETILSVINQSIGFKQNIQMILVNDGSTDNSEKICLKYRNRYPENIKYIYQENQGVSSARNAGMEFMEGKYANFFDSDDVWNLDVFEKVYDFFEENEEYIDIVACRQKFFEAKEGYHKLDYKFEKNYIVDIIQNYDCIQLSTSSAFIKTDEVKKYKYDSRLKYAEDVTLIGQILMQKSKYGILSDAIYNYRKRNNNTSALQIRENDKSWYFDTIEYGYKLLINKSIEKYHRVLPYFQYQIMYDIQWRMKVDISKILNKEEQKEYVNELISLLQYIDDNIIMKQKYLWKEYKILALCLKYRKDIRKEVYYKDDKIYFNNLKMFNIKSNSLLKISEIKISLKNKLIIKGLINCFLPEDDYKIYIKINDGKEIYIENYKIINNRKSIIGNLNNCKEFIINIPLQRENTEIKIMFDYKDNQRRLNLVFNDFSNLIDKDVLYVYAKNNKIVQEKNNKLKVKYVDKDKIKQVRKEIIKQKKENREIQLKKEQI